MKSISITYNIYSQKRGLSRREQSCFFQLLRMYKKDISDIKYKHFANGNTEYIYFTVTFRDTEEKLRYEQQLILERFLTSNFYKWVRKE